MGKQRAQRAGWSLIVRRGEAGEATLDSLGSVMGPMTWDRALKTWCEQELDSDQTRKTYSSAVRQFYATPGMPGDLDALTIDLLAAYRGRLVVRASEDAPPADRLAPSTVNLRLAALRSFLDFCKTREWLDLSAEQLARALKAMRASVQRPYQIVTGGEWDVLLWAAEQQSEPGRWWRWRSAPACGFRSWWGCGWAASSATIPAPL